MKVCRLVCLMFIFLFITCAGIRFKDYPIEEIILPKDYTQRPKLQGLAALRHEPELLVGWIIIPSNDTLKVPIKVAPFATKDYTPQIKYIKDPPLYSGKLTASAKINGSYLVGGLKATADCAYELVIQDNFYVITNDTLLLIDEIVAFGKEFHDSTINKMYVVVGIEHTTISYRAFKKISSHATLSGGDVFGAEGNVYYSTDTYLNDYVISADLRPLSYVIKHGSIMMNQDTTEIEFFPLMDLLINFKTGRSMTLKELQEIGFRGKYIYDYDAPTTGPRFPPPK